MKRPAQDAKARLLAHYDSRECKAGPEATRAYTPKPTTAARAKTRRLLNALLRERAEAAVNDLRSTSLRRNCAVDYWAEVERAIRAAVTGRKP